MFCLQFAFWYWLTGLVIKLYLRVQENRIEQRIEVLEKFDEIVHRVLVEKHGSEYYWFDADDNEFLAQGKDIDEALERIKKRYPSHIFFVADHTYQYKVSAATEWKLEPYKTLETNKG